MRGPIKICPIETGYAGGITPYSKTNLSLLHGIALSKTGKKRGLLRKKNCEMHSCTKAVVCVCVHKRSEANWISKFQNVTKSAQK